MIFSIFNNHKCLSAFFEYLYVMGLRPLLIFYPFSAGIDFRRQNLRSEVGPCAEREGLIKVGLIAPYLSLKLWE